jgi:hypothetical protein
MPPKRRGGKKKKGRKKEQAGRDVKGEGGDQGGEGGGGAAGVVDDPDALIELCCAGGSGDVGEARDLIARGINIDEQDNNGDTALMYAAMLNRTEMVKELVSAGVALDVQNKCGSTP